MKVHKKNQCYFNLDTHILLPTQETMFMQLEEEALMVF